MATRWLFKTEPSVYSYQQLEKDKKTVWDGVANNLALKNLKDIKRGERFLSIIPVMKRQQSEWRVL